METNHSPESQIIRVSEQATQITRELYQKLNGKVLNANTMAEALAAYCPGMSAEQLRDVCLILRQGVQSGERKCQDALEDFQRDLNLASHIRKAVDGIDENSKREYLILLYKSVCQINGFQISPEHTAFLNSLSVERLIAEDAELMEQQGAVSSQTALETLKKRFDTDSSASALQWEKEQESYSSSENAWILSAGLYAASDKANVIQVSPMELAESAGYQTEAISTVKRNFAQSGLAQVGVPVTMLVSMGTASVWGACAAMGGVLNAAPAFLQGLGLFAAGSVVPDVLSVIFATSVVLPVVFGLGMMLTAWAVGKYMDWLDAKEPRQRRSLMEHLRYNEDMARQYLPQSDEAERDIEDDSHYDEYEDENEDEEEYNEML